MYKQRTVLALLALIVLAGGMLAPVGIAMAAKNSPDAWVPGPTPPWGYWRFDGQYYAPQGRVYFLSGRTGGAATISPRVWYFDVATSAFVDTGTDMPTGVANYFIVQLTDATGPGLFVFGGTDATGSYTTGVQVYRPESNTAGLVTGDVWPGGTPTPGCPDFPGAAVAYNNKAYIMGGFNSVCGEVSAETWIYDPMGAAGARFTAGPALTLARAYIPATVVDNYLYALGGDEYIGGLLTVTPRTERLDLSNPAATWDDASVAEMPAAPSSGIAGCDEVAAYGFNTTSPTELAGKIAIGGCGQWSSEYADSFIYDVATNTWANWEALTIARRNYASALVSGPSGVALWIFGGRSGSDTGIASTEYRTVAVTPTAVELVGLDSFSQPAFPYWLLGLAGLALLGATGMGVARARARG